MNDEHPGGGSESRRIDELGARVAANRTDIDLLLARADAANHRADANDARADSSDARIGRLEGRVDVDEQLIVELQAEGMLRADSTAHLKEALGSSRMIGTAVGIVMAIRKVSQEEAFQTLKQASNRTNCKLRVIADYVVRTGDVNDLPTSSA